MFYFHFYLVSDKETGLVSGVDASGLNIDIQNCYKIEKRTILWQQEYNKTMKKEQERQKQEELKQSKKIILKYLF